MEIQPMPRKFLYSLTGITAGLLVPFAALLWQAYSDRREWWDEWLKTEFHKHGITYFVVGLFAAIVFSLLGYFIGHWRDVGAMESESMRDSNLTLAQLASTDGLTGLLNTRAVHERLDIELENSYRSPLTCLLVDIDHFKRINDTHGHPFGDTVLATVGDLLKKSVRDMDAVGRLGGEEFIVILPRMPGDRALVVAERIRKMVHTEEFISDDKKVPVTVSLGLVTYPSENLNTKDKMLKAVDEALYAAKRGGRNRIVVWKEDIASG
jgi:diguanylate cyclase (GGDEF)-like protein